MKDVLPVRVTRVVRVGEVAMGGDFPVRIQSMWKTRIPDDLEALCLQLDELRGLGCEIIRFAAPDQDGAQQLVRLAKTSPLPVVADIHFDYRIALTCLDGVAKIRINPGNIGARWKVEEVVRKATDKGIPIRVGVNAGSLPRSLKTETDLATAMVKAAEDEIDILEALGFRDIVISLKSSDIETTVRANTEFSEKHDYPLHLGLTEAGPVIQGVVKSTLAMGSLLENGVGSTLRVSLSGPCADEVLAAREILTATGRRSGGVRIVSCPKCGRTGFDVHGFLEQVQPWLLSLEEELSVAVMGCVVNGPDEAKHADIGITGAGKEVVIFRDGELRRKAPLSEAAVVFREEVEALCADRKG